MLKRLLVALVVLVAAAPAVLAEFGLAGEPKIAFIFHAAVEYAAGTTNSDNPESFYARTYQGFYPTGMIG